MKKILVTGNAGFIGSHLAEKLLLLGHFVHGLDNFDDFYPRSIKKANLKIQESFPNYFFTEGDIRSKDMYTQLPGDFDMVIHLAAKAGIRPSIENTDLYIETNINGTQNLLDWMVKRKIQKLIFGSSSSIYGNNEKIPFSESDAVDQPISPYAFTKKAGELLNYSYHHLYAIDILNLRFFTVYGPRQRPDLAIRKFVELIKNEKPISIYGDGLSGRDYTYIDDIVDGIVKSMEYLFINRNTYEVINLGNSSPVKLCDLVDTIYEILGKPKSVEHLPAQDGDVNLTYANISKARQLLGYTPQNNIRQGLTKFIEWHENHNS